MNKSELLQKCKEMGIRGVSSKNKNEILIIINEYERKQNNIQINSNINKDKFTKVLDELKIKIPKDKLRKVCKNCNELGHNTNSIDCRIYIDKNNKLRQKIKNIILTRDCLENKNIEDYCDELSTSLSISSNLCKTLYCEIPLDGLVVNQKMDINKYLNTTNQFSKKCSECNKKLLYIQVNTNRIWKGNSLCDTCWSKYDDERELIWKQIKVYKPLQCSICSKQQIYSSERYHYDHINMFNKTKSICIMINEGVDIKEICCEIDKCQILCLPCHHIITDIEHKIGFTRIKSTLTRKLNQCEITEEQHNEQMLHFQKIYEDKMNKVYTDLKFRKILEKKMSIIFKELKLNF